MPITMYACEKLGGEVITDKDKVSYCKVDISKRKVNEERVRRFKAAVAKCKGRSRNEFKECMRKELKGK